MEEKFRQKVQRFANILRTKIIKIENQLENDCFVDKKMLTKSLAYQEILEIFEEHFDDDF